MWLWKQNPSQTLPLGWLGCAVTAKLLSRPSSMVSSRDTHLESSPEGVQCDPVLVTMSWDEVGL